MSLREDMYKAVKACPLPVHGGAYLYRGRVSGDTCDPITALAAYLKFVDLGGLALLRGWDEYTPPAFELAIETMLEKLTNHYGLSWGDWNAFGQCYDRFWSLDEALALFEPEKEWNF